MGDRRFIHKKNRDDAIRVLKILVESLEQHNVKYYLDFGSLIGAVRDNGLIPWDDDIDISLFDESDYNKVPDVLNDIRKKHKLRTYIFTFEWAAKKRSKRRKEVYVDRIKFTNKENFQIAKVRTNRFWFFGRGNTCIDIFFKYKFEGDSYWLANARENSVPIELTCEDLTRINFCGVQCWIPKEYDDYLTYIYGDWKTPKEQWDHDEDVLCIND